MRSSHGEIEVFLCPDDPTLKTPVNQTTTTTTTTAISESTFKSSCLESLAPELVMRPEKSIKSETILPEEPTHSDMPSVALQNENVSAGMRDALLSESDDFSPMGGGKYQLQTDDQNSMLGTNQCTIDNHLSNCPNVRYYVRP